MLRLVGGRFGPVLRTEPHDSMAQALQWQDDLEAHAGDLAVAPARDVAVEALPPIRRPGRFTRDGDHSPAAPPRSIQH